MKARFLQCGVKRPAFHVAPYRQHAGFPMFVMQLRALCRFFGLIPIKRVRCAEQATPPKSALEPGVFPDHVETFPWTARVLP